MPMALPVERLIAEQPHHGGETPGPRGAAQAGETPEPFASASALPGRPSIGWPMKRQTHDVFVKSTAA